MIPLLQAYSALSLTFNGVSGGQTFNETSSYSTNYVSSTTYSISLTTSISSNGGTPQSSTSTIWILKNGTTIAVDEDGYNLTGTEGVAITTGFFAGFYEEVDIGGQLNTYTASSYFHSTGTSTVTIGPSTFKVTNYAANTLPETFTTCGVGSTTLTQYTLSVGTPGGSSYPLVTSQSSREARPLTVRPRIST